MKSKNYNTTQLCPEKQHQIHRDYIAHCLRWVHVIKHAPKSLANVLDFGCGTGNLYETLYRSKYNLNKYIGLDIRQSVIENNIERFPKADWHAEDLAYMKKIYKVDNGWDIIACFEVLEHVGKQNTQRVLENIKNHCGKSTMVFISSPCYDERVGAAGNHTYDSGDSRGVAIQEFTYHEMKSMLKKYFIIEKVYGTFISQKDYKQLLNDWQQKMFDGLKDYFDSNMLSNIIAPFFPKQARNCLWRCKLR